MLRTVVGVSGLTFFLFVVHLGLELSAHLVALASEACGVPALTDVAFVKLGDEWFKMNDSVVICVDEEQVLHAEAFMLFYRKPLLPSTV